MAAVRGVRLVEAVYCGGGGTVYTTAVRGVRRQRRRCTYPDGGGEGRGDGVGRCSVVRRENGGGLATASGVGRAAARCTAAAPVNPLKKPCFGFFFLERKRYARDTGLAGQ